MKWSWIHTAHWSLIYSAQIVVAKIHDNCSLAADCNHSLEDCYDGSCHCIQGALSWAGGDCIDKRLHGQPCEHQAQCSMTGDPHLHCIQDESGHSRCSCTGGMAYDSQLELCAGGWLDDTDTNVTTELPGTTNLDGSIRSISDQGNSSVVFDEVSEFWQNSILFIGPSVIILLSLIAIFLFCCFIRMDSSLNQAELQMANYKVSEDAEFSVDLESHGHRNPAFSPDDDDSGWVEAEVSAVSGEASEHPQEEHQPPQCLTMTHPEEDCDLRRDKNAAKTRPKIKTNPQLTNCTSTTSTATTTTTTTEVREKEIKDDPDTSQKMEQQKEYDPQFDNPFVIHGTSLQFIDESSGSLVQDSISEMNNYLPGKSVRKIELVDTDDGTSIETALPEARTFDELNLFQEDILSFQNGMSPRNRNEKEAEENVLHEGDEAEFEEPGSSAPTTDDAIPDEE